MKAIQGLVVVCLGIMGCAPYHGRAASMCPTSPCGPMRVVTVNDCDTSPHGVTSFAVPGSNHAPTITSESRPVDQRINALENDLRSLKSDVGDVQRRDKQMDRKLDKLIDHIEPLK